jgi:hypothetical protein
VNQARRSGWVTKRIADATTAPDGLVMLATDMGKLATQLSQDAADAIARSFEQRVPVYLGIVRQIWPVKTGYSQSRFRIAIKQAGAFFQVSIVNDADYAGWVRHKEKRPTLAAVRLVFDPFAPVAAEIARDVADYVGD